MEAASPNRVDAGAGVSIDTWGQIVHSIRTKVTSIHHNFCSVVSEKLGVSWRPTEECVWLLGRRYRPPPVEQPPSSTSGRSSPSTGGARDDGDTQRLSSSERFCCRYCGSSNCKIDLKGAGLGITSALDFNISWVHIARMTYRRGFAPMYRRACKPSDGAGKCMYIRLTSDAGWGCMIRVGQMLLATALKRHANVSKADQKIVPEVDRQVSGSFHFADSAEPTPSNLWSEFFDDPNQEKCPFSIFGFIRAAHGREITVPLGQESGNDTQGFNPAMTLTGTDGQEFAPSRKVRPLTKKLPGDWFGPTTISETIAALVDFNPKYREQFAVYVNSDGMLYEDEVRALARRQPPGPRFQGAQPCKAISAPQEAPWSTVRDTSKCGGGFEGDFNMIDNVSVVPVSPPLIASSEAAPTVLGQEVDANYLDSLPPPHSPRDSANDEKGDKWDRGILMLFPLQLGSEKYVSEANIPALLRYFELPASLGAMGGRPRMAHFFVGRQGRGLLYVDPHVVQPAVVLSSGSDVAECAATYACSDAGMSTTGTAATGAFAEPFRNIASVQIIPVENIDSSISVAFYCQRESDLTDLIAGLKDIESLEPECPIRVEATRPAALRSPRVNCDSISLSLDEEDEADLEGESKLNNIDTQSTADTFDETADEGDFFHDVVEVPLNGMSWKSSKGTLSGTLSLAAAQAPRQIEQPTKTRSPARPPPVLLLPDGSGSAREGVDGGRLMVGSPWSDGPWAYTEIDGGISFAEGLA